MDEIVKISLIKIANMAYMAGRNGMTPEAFQVLLRESIKISEEQAEADEVKFHDPNYAIN